jgi:hypothetical protein
LKLLLISNILFPLIMEFTFGRPTPGWLIGHRGFD